MRAPPTVPVIRRFCSSGEVRITDQDIFDWLAGEQGDTVVGLLA